MTLAQDALALVRDYERQLAELRLELRQEKRRADQAQSALDGMMDPDLFWERATAFGVTFKDLMKDVRITITLAPDGLWHGALYVDAT